MNDIHIYLINTSTTNSFAVFLTSHTLTDEDCQVGLAGSLVELLKAEQDEENMYRTLVALGTLVCSFFILFLL